MAQEKTRRTIDADCKQPPGSFVAFVARQEAAEIAAEAKRRARIHKQCGGSLDECDLCHDDVPHRMLTFNGAHFLCGRCRGRIGLKNS